MEIAYHEYDIKLLFDKRNWQDWDDILYWLKQYGRLDSDLQQDKVEQLIVDVERVRDYEVPFTLDPWEAFKVIKQYHRG